MSNNDIRVQNYLSMKLICNLISLIFVRENVVEENCKFNFEFDLFVFVVLLQSKTVNIAGTSCELEEKHNYQYTNIVRSLSF